MMAAKPQDMAGDSQKEPEAGCRNPAEYENYIVRNFDCMRADGYKVVISPRLYYRAAKDRKIGRWLEDNLDLLPYCTRRLQDMTAATGGRIVRCTYYMDNYNNISAEVCAADRLSEAGQLCGGMANRSVIRMTSVGEIEEQARYNSIFWTPEIESAGFKAKA